MTGSGAHEGHTGGEEEVARLFDEQITQRWDWSQAHSRALPELRQAVADAIAGHLDDAGLVAVACRCAGNEAAAATLAEQCRAVVRAALRDAQGDRQG